METKHTPRKSASRQAAPRAPAGPKTPAAAGAKGVARKEVQARVKVLGADVRVRKTATPMRKSSAQRKIISLLAPEPSDDVPSFVELYRMVPDDKVSLVKTGVPAADVAKLAKLMGQSKESLLDILGFSRPTIDRQARARKPLSVEHSERLVGISTLIGQVQEMVAKSGNPEGFDAAKWVSAWLETPLSALAGHRPAEYMDTKTGQDLVSDLLSRSQSGAYS